MKELRNKPTLNIKGKIDILKSNIEGEGIAKDEEEQIQYNFEMEIKDFEVSISVQGMNGGVIRSAQFRLKPVKNFPIRGRKVDENIILDQVYEFAKNQEVNQSELKTSGTELLDKRAERKSELQISKEKDIEQTIISKIARKSPIGIKSNGKRKI